MTPKVTRFVLRGLGGGAEGFGFFAALPPALDSSWWMRMREKMAFCLEAR
jgi:hypothetical protein